VLAVLALILFVLAVLLFVTVPPDTYKPAGKSLSLTEPVFRHNSALGSLIYLGFLVPIMALVSLTVPRGLSTKSKEVVPALGLGCLILAGGIVAGALRIMPHPDRYLGITGVILLVGYVLTPIGLIVLGLVTIALILRWAASVVNDGAGAKNLLATAQALGLIVCTVIAYGAYLAIKSPKPSE